MHYLKTAVPSVHTMGMPTIWEKVGALGPMYAEIYGKATSLLCR